MRRTTTNARFIKAHSIQIGDTIKVEETWHDATIVKTGKVAKRNRESFGTEYLTGAGIVLHTDTNDGLTKVKITLLDRAMNVIEMETLF